jgi:hypothetical protein
MVRKEIVRAREADSRGMQLVSWATAPLLKVPDLTV